MAGSRAEYSRLPPTSDDVAPLLPVTSNSDDDHPIDVEAGGIDEDGIDKDVDESSVVVPGEDTTNLFVLILVGSASVSGLLFGYDTGIISGTLVTIGQDLGTELSTWQKEVITAATTLGALLGGLVAGAMSDYTGRKKVLALANMVFISGAWVQAVAHSVNAMVTGRFVVGLGVGLASCIAPLYIGELAPTRQRGRLVTINAVACTFGQVVAYAIGAAFATTTAGWRWMVGLGALPAMIQLASLAFLPESPRILLLGGNVSAVERVMGRVYPLAAPQDLTRKVAYMRAALQRSARIEATTTWSERAGSLFKVGAHRRALTIGCGLQALQQLCGFNSLLYFSSSIFAVLGFDNPIGTGMIIAVANFLFTLVALKIVDPVGRRTVMLWTVPNMAVALLFVSLAFHFLTRSSGGVLIPGTDYPPNLTMAVLAGMVVYVAAYATGCGNIPWQQGELFALEVRGLGTSICTATNWACNLVIAATFLTLMETISPSGAFALYAVVCAAGWVFCYFLYPETSGLSLEQVYEVFRDGFGVAKSQELRAAKEANARDVTRRTE